MPPPPAPSGSSSGGGGGPSIRLNISASRPGSRSNTPPPGKASTVSSGAPSSSTSQSKKRRFAPPTSLQPSIAQAYNTRLLHQKTSLSFVLNRHPNAITSNGTWHAQGVTTLYVLTDVTADNSPSVTATAGATSAPKDNKKSTIPLQLALHLRKSCEVCNVQVQSTTVNNDKNKSIALGTLDSSYHHFDPLERPLLKPATSYTMEDIASKIKRHEADSQFSRGAVGITKAIRAGSIASNMGELRISTSYIQTDNNNNNNNEAQIRMAKECWKADLLGNDSKIADGETAKRLLQEQLEPRVTKRRDARLDVVTKALAGGSISSKSKQKAVKITIQYKILLGSNDAFLHFGGIHATTLHSTPHIYTTSGVYGDHEGPRCWIPTLDSASTKHRATHEITITVTAPMTEGLSVVGCGEDFGVAETLLHDRLIDNDDAMKTKQAKELGKYHMEMISKIHNSNNDDAMAVDKQTLHIIPPESNANNPILSMDSILATSIWSSSSWVPIPARSLGFAIGPFRVLEDPEYFGVDVEEDTGDDDDLGVEEAMEEIEAARENGEGIRQAYFVPIFARKHIHAKANHSLIPKTRFQITPLTASQSELLNGLDQSVLMATAGVPHRALSLMRDILALPCFRTVSYTQIWIPKAVHGGSTSGALHNCPEVLVNPFLGGAIMDARLLPPVGHRLPHHHGGRVLQFLQARCAVRGWIISAIPLGGRDDVGQGYIFTLIESFLMSLYERGHGAHGEGGAKGSVFFTKRFSSGSGLNSSNLDFLPVQNIEDVDFDVVVGGVMGAVPVEDRNNDQLWRSASNGTESHTSGIDEYAVRQLLTLDVVNALERGTEKKSFVPAPSLGWFGSHLSLSFLSSNATSSSDVGCGAVELVHPVGGLPYRALKSELFRRVVEGRAGISNFVRLVRAAFVAAHLDDDGKKELQYSPGKSNKATGKTPEKQKSGATPDAKADNNEETEKPKPRFIVCVNELLKKKGLTHTLFTRALQNLAGRVREAQLLGTLVDVERDSKDPRTNRPFVDPEGFPNSYVRGASELYLRVGVHVEPSKDSGSGIAKGIQLQPYAEPVIPEGGIAYGGPITLRVVENEGQFREFVKDINADGSRRDWGSLFLHAKPVTLPKAQTAASGIIESGTSTVKQAPKASNAPEGSKDSSPKRLLDGTSTATGAFSESSFHRGGYQAIELIRLTNLTPLLWVRVDPMGLYGGRISVFQPDACLAEMVFHDGDAGAQVDALRALAERPLRIQGSVKVTSVYDVKVSELPVRVLGDCLRGSPALHSSLPHTPAVRANAALAIGQWQNNKAPTTRNAMGENHWVGLYLLIQYFRERFYNNGKVMPIKFNRVVLKKNNVVTSEAAANVDGVALKTKKEDASYHYLDSFDEEDREAVLDEVDDVEVEEDEEYRVRSAVITAVASIRAKDGLTPSAALQFLETVLEAVDAELVGNLVSPDEEVIIERKRRRMMEGKTDADVEAIEDTVADTASLSRPHASSVLVADALLALCHVNVSPALITDPRTGKPVQSSASHPVTKLMETCRRWLDWELYREGIRAEIESRSLSGISGNCYDSIAACAITSLSVLAIQRQSTTDDRGGAGKNVPEEKKNDEEDTTKPKNDEPKAKPDESATASFYIKIFDSKPHRSDVTRAACAQAMACICCAADRFESDLAKSVGLLTSLEFMLDWILDKTTSPCLRQTLAQLMLDVCTGKICSMQRIGAIGGRNDLISSAARFFGGPLGASHGGDNGSAAVTNVDPVSYPAANAVNDGARRGLKLMKGAGDPRKGGVSQALIVRLAIFATKLWRTINGEPVVLEDDVPGQSRGNIGVCAYDGQLRCALLALWQWIWPRGCFAVMQVQTWKPHEKTQHYKDIGADRVMKTSDEEKDASNAEDDSLKELDRLVGLELDRQKWRGEMATKAYEGSKIGKKGSEIADASAAEQGINQPLPPVQRDDAFRAGGWIASAAQQRRALALDGGTAVTKFRLRKSGD